MFVLHKAIFGFSVSIFDRVNKYTYSTVVACALKIPKGCVMSF